ncbi:MAG: Fpg/Nei family DNA glycosylase [Actinomycetota bacterium]|nr:Fpg/Nei family DNA glycosylase [Actinomycetota bacterium]
MPELPEVEALARRLTERTAGREVTRVEVASVAALQTFDPPVEALIGRRVLRWERRGKYLCLESLGGPWLVVHLARSGWLRWREELSELRARPGKGPLALRVGFGREGFELTEVATEKRLGIWVVHDLQEVEGLARLGIDALSEQLTVDALARLAEQHKGHVKALLVDQSAIAGVGNAYSDEVLHAARLSPFKPASHLDRDELARLHAALVGVLTDALERTIDLGEDRLKDDKRKAMAVHGRAGSPCPVCGDIVRSVSFAAKSWQYCPTCQTGGRQLADRRLSRLLR